MAAGGGRRGKGARGSGFVAVGAAAEHLRRKLCGPDSILREAERVFGLAGSQVTLQARGPIVVLRSPHRETRSALRGIEGPIAEWLREHGLGHIRRVLWSAE